MSNGWEIRTFADVLEIRNGKNQKEVLSEDGPYPIYGSAGTLMGYATDYLCEAGTTIIGRKGSINNPIYVDTRFWNVDTAFGLSPRDGLDSRFLYYFCLGYDFGSHNQGTTIPSLVKTDLLKITIPIPPIEEQRRIVAILDEAFAAIDKAKANTEKNIQNARELFDSYLNNIFSNPGPDWESTTLGNIGKVSMCKRVYKEQTMAAGDIPFYKIGTFGKEPDAFISADIYNEFRTRYSYPRKGEVLISAAGTIGRLVRYDGEPAYFQDSNIVWVENDERRVSNDYLYYFYGSCKWGSTDGATIARLYNVDLRQIPISFPRLLAEQRCIVADVEAMSSQIEKLGNNYRRQSDQLDMARRAVLQKALTGAL